MPLAQGLTEDTSSSSTGSAATRAATTPDHVAVATNHSSGPEANNVTTNVNTSKGIGALELIA